MIFDILEDKLVADGHQRGVDLFAGTLPADVSVGVMLRYSLAGLKIDPEIPEYHSGVIQVITRHKDPVLGEKMATRIGRLLEMRSARESYPATADRGAVTLLTFYPQTLPITYPRLEGNGFEWSQSWNVKFSAKRLPL